MDLGRYIKKKPSDFIVEEVLPFKPLNKGSYKLFRLKKSNLSTIQVIRFLSKLLGVKPSQIGFAGLKDKFAITTQFITIPQDIPVPDCVCYQIYGGKWVKKEKIDLQKEHGFCAELIGFTEKPLEIGENKGNRFLIKIHNLTKEDRKRFYSNLQIVMNYGSANYFGEQRFGSVKGRNDFIFLYLLKGETEKALKHYFSIKGSVKNWGKWEELYRDFRGKLEQYERDLILGLKRGLSPEKAIKILPKNIRLMFNFAFQSYLWNEYLRKYIEKKYPFKRVGFINRWKLSFYTEVYDLEYLKNLKIPYTGRGYPPEDELLADIIEKTLKESGIKEKDIGKEVAGIEVLTDGLRDAVFFPEDFKVVEKTKNSIRVSFFLPTGSYATVLLRNLVS
ncbi:tRNA pseudouridine(13) synthase TruD [Persephonella sp.]